MITIIDYGIGNLGSVFNMFRHIGVKAVIEKDIEEIKKAQKILLPGVGSFDSAMERINSAGLKEVLNEKALREKVPVLGICLGMQLLTMGSDEGVLPGLGWIDAKTARFSFGDEKKLKVPHMGWNTVQKINASRLTEGLQEDARFYFVHSYYVLAKHSENSVLRTSYGVDFDSMIQKDNIFGAQFHPEKSHKFGMKVFENFSKL